MNLFPKETIPYCIVAPSYTHISSGVRTLHLLCHALNEMGQKAFIIADDPNGFATNPHLNTPIMGDLPQYQNFYTKSAVDPIFVYHNLIKGNPLNAKRVVRYLLAPAGSYKGETEFGENDQIWGALPTIAQDVLRLPVSDTNIFYEDGGPRHGSCFYSLKYDKITGNELLPITENSTRLVGTLHEVADILRRSEVCYVYEVTSILTEAALCGCPVVLVRTPQFETIDPACMMGYVRWDNGELVKDCGHYLPEYNNIVWAFEGQLLNFVKKTQAML